MKWALSFPFTSMSELIHGEIDYHNLQKTEVNIYVRGSEEHLADRGLVREEKEQGYRD